MFFKINDELGILNTLYPLPEPAKSECSFQDEGYSGCTTILILPQPFPWRTWWPDLFFFFFFMDDPGIRRTRCLFWESEFLCRALFLGHQQDFKVAQCNRHLFPYLCANELVFKVHTFIISHIELGILWLAVCFRLSPWVFHKIFVHLVKMASQIGNTSHFIWYTPRSPLCILWTES